MALGMFGSLMGKISGAVKSKTGKKVASAGAGGFSSISPRSAQTPRGTTSQRQGFLSFGARKKKPAADLSE